MNTAGAAGRDSSWGHSDNIRPKFTGQLRDTETGMDYFIARYYGNALGRFVSPDPANAGANASDPQTWNGYAYVRGNPLNAIDPTGLDPADAPIAVDCPSCTVTVYGGSPDWVSLWWFYGGVSNGLSWGSRPGDNGGGNTSGVTFTATGVGPADVPTVSTRGPQQLVPPKSGIDIRAPSQTFGACMAQHANEYSLGGLLDTSYGLATGKDSTLSTNPLASFVLGNSINTLLFGSGGEAASPP